MLFCCIWRNVEGSCHKHFVVVSRHQLTPPLTTSDKCHNLQDRGPAARVDNTWPVAALTTRGEARYRLRIAISACIPHLHSTPLLGGFPPKYCDAVWCGQTRMTQTFPQSAHFLLTTNQFCRPKRKWPRTPANFFPIF